MALQFSNSTKTVLDPNANNPDYQIDPITGKYVLKKLPVVVDQSSRIKTTTPPVFDQSDRSTTEGTGDKVPYVNPQAGRGNKPPKTAPPKPEEVSGVPAVTTPTTGLDDTKTGTGRSTENGGVNKNTDTEPITVPPVNPDTMSNAPPPVVVKPDPVVVDDDPYADPPGREDDDPGPNYNPQFEQSDTTPVTVPPATTPPAVVDPPLSDEDQIIDDTRADSGLEDTMSNDPVEPEVPAGTQAYNSFQQKIQSAISSGQLGGLPSKDEIRADRFLNGDQKTALLNMYPKPPVAETPAVDTSVPLDDTVIPSTGESTEGEADVVPDKVQRTSLNTADLQGWAKRASAGEVNIDEIKGLNLTPLQENSLISSYNTGVTNRAAAEQLALDNQTAEEQRIADEAEEARIRQEAADEQQRKQDELDAAATADEQRKITARQGLVQGFKDSLLADPDFVVNMDQLRGSDPTAADELQYWMETSSEYLKAAKDAGLSGESKTEVGSEYDVTEDGEAEATELDEYGRPPIPTTYNGKPIDIDYLISQGEVDADEPWVFYSSAEYPMLNIPEPGRWEPNFIMSIGLPPQEEFMTGPDGKPLIGPDGLPVKLPGLTHPDGTPVDPRDLGAELGYEGYGQDIQQQVAIWQGSNPRQSGELDHEYHNRMARDLKSEKIGLRSAPGYAMGQELSQTHPWLKREDDIRGPLIGPDGKPLIGPDGLPVIPPGQTDPDATTDETNEAFLSRMPAVPANLDNIDAFNWLADQGVTAEDAQKWFDWAKSTGRAAVDAGTGTEVGGEFDVTDDEVPFYDDSEKTDDTNLEQYATITPDLDPEKIRSLVEDFKFDTASVVRAGELLKSDGQDAYDGYVEAIQRGEGPAWEANYKELMDASDDGVDNAEDDDEVDSIYVVGSPEYEAAVAAVSIEDLILRIPEPPTDLDAMGKFFWLASQVDDAGNPLLTATEAQAYYEWSKKQQEDVDANTSLDGDGGIGDASDPSNLESIQTTIADEIEKVVKDMGFNSEEYKTSQTTAIDARYEDARVRLGRQFAIDPGGTKTGRAQRAFETIENQRIQDLATLDTEVQDRLQAARDSTITNLVNAFSSITTGKMAEDQLDEQERQFNTELRESVRQFNNDIALRLKEFGLDETQIEAAIAKINSDMVNNTRAISAEISQAWADITGDVGVPGGVISLEDLGIPESEWSMFPYLPASDDMKDTIKMSFEAMLGRSITDDEMTNLMSNGRIKVDDNMPTQRAREFAATITQQNMDRISQYDAIAESNGLDRDKFTDAKERADKDWARTNLEVAEEFGLDNNTFRNSMWDLDQRLSKIFFNEDYTEVERDMQRRNAINAVSKLYFPDEQGSFLQAKDQYDILYGDRERAVALAFGMDGETFSRANRQADTQEKRFLDVWSSLLADVEVETANADSWWKTTYEKAQKEGEDSLDGWFERHARLIPGVNQFFKERPITDTAVDFSWDAEINQFYLGNLNTTLMEVDGMDELLGSVNVDIAGIQISIPSGKGFSADEATSLFFDNSTESQKDAMMVAFNAKLPSGAIQNDDTLKANMRNYFQSVLDSPDGENPGHFDIQYTPGDWFGRQDPETQSAIMSLLGTTTFSPERAAGGTSALASIGRAFGIGGGALIGGYLGGPAGVAAGAQAGAAL